jgi:hypothetical protein
MTREEQEAYFAKREQELLGMCRIRSLEQFLEECTEAGIPGEWYAFTFDRAKPVSMDDDTVYYGRSGKTIVSYPFQRWDIAYRELLRYKEEYEWEATGAAYRITSVKWESNADISAILGNSMTLRECRFSEEPEQEMLDDGWTYDHYDRYMGYSVYYKHVPAGSVMRSACIAFRFMKRTDMRDAETFGFREGTYISGTYRYPVPRDLRDRIRSDRYFPVFVSKEIRETLTERLAGNLIEDEFEDLRAFREDGRKALSAAFDPKLSRDDQKDAFAKASSRAEAGHPAVDNYEGSRCHTVIHDNLHRAYDLAGLEW